MDRRELTPLYSRYLVRLIRPFPNWDFFFIKSLRRRAVKVLRLEVGNRALDAGCGPGGTFPYLVDAVGPQGEVVGIEISPETANNAIRRIEANHWDSVHLIEGDAKTVKLTGMFDGLVMFAAPDVYASPEAVANLFSYMKDDARIVVFGAKLSRHRLGAIFNILFLTLMKLSFPTTPTLDYDPLRALRNRVSGFEMQEYVFGCMFLAWGSIERETSRRTVPKMRREL